MHRHGALEPEIVGSAAIEGGDVTDAGVGLDPFSIARIDDEVDAVGGDGKIAGLEWGGVEFADGAGDGEVDGGFAVALAQGLGAGVIPPLGGGFADGVAVAVTDAVDKKGIAQGAAGEA